MEMTSTFFLSVVAESVRRHADGGNTVFIMVLRPDKKPLCAEIQAQRFSRLSDSGHRECEVFSDVFRILHTHVVFGDLHFTNTENLLTREFK